MPPAPPESVVESVVESAPAAGAAPTVHALVVAAGRGTRAGPGGPKQYRPLGGVPVLRRTLAALGAAGVDRIAVVIHADDAAAYAAAVAGLALPLAPPVAGGATRQESVRLGLEALAAAPDDLVLIHDAARPFVSPRLVAGVREALAAHPAACPGLPLVDTLRRDADGFAGELLPRDGLTRAQTPQGFRFAAILDAHRRAAEAGLEATDDAELARAAGLPVALTQGDPANLKLTTPEDFMRAEAAFSPPPPEYRAGTGFDVHAFGPGDRVTLCGVTLPFDRGLSAHSDGDVGMHALTDAIFGALAEGDIGRWFPPSDPQWKGADSAIFLRKAAERVAARGGRIVNVDVTLICEAPKIGPHSSLMQRRLAEILGIDTGRVSVKATTTERLGFPGRGEGIAAQACASLALPADAPAAPEAGAT